MQLATYYKQIGYWVDLLQLHVPGAVVKLVGTHQDQTECSNEKKDKVKECVLRQIADHRANLATELVRVSHLMRTTAIQTMTSLGFRTGYEYRQQIL